jgi:hypothetical protein
MLLRVVIILFHAYNPTFNGSVVATLMSSDYFNLFDVPFAMTIHLPSLM